MFIFPLFFVVLGLVLGISGYHRWSQQQPVSGGLQTTGHIQSVQQQVDRSRSGTATTYTPTVQFTDQAGQLITFVGPTLNSSPKLDSEQGDYLPVRVSYNPRHPSGAHLLGDTSGDVAGIYVGVGLTVVGVAWGAVLVRKFRRYRKWYPLGRLQRRFPTVKRVIPRAEDKLAARTKILDVYEGTVDGVTYHGKLVVDAKGIGIDSFEVCAPAPLRIWVRVFRHYVVIWESAQTCTVASVIGGDRSATPNALGDVRLTVSSGDHAWSVIVPGANPGVVEARLKQYYAGVTTAV